MQKLVWQNANGDTIDLTSGNYGITQWEGFSNTSLNIQSQQVPFQDGGVFLDALLEQRDLSVTLKMNDGGNLENRYRMRRELIHILNPKLGEGYLIYTNDFTSKRIKCVAQVPLFETHNSNDSGTPSASLAWTACEPYWEDLEEIKVTLTKGFNVPVTNEGDVAVGFELTVMENGNNIFLQNQTTEKKLEINKSVNGVVKINTNVGKKTVIETEYQQKIAKIGQFYELLNKGNVFLAMGEIVATINNYDNLDIISKGVGYDGRIINDLFFALAMNKVNWSINGNLWNETTGYDIAYGNNRYFIPANIGIGYGGKLYDENMQFIAEITITGSSNAYERVAFTNNMFLIIQGEGTNLAPEQERHYSFEVAISTNGESWTRKTSLVLEDEPRIDFAIGFDNNILIKTIGNKLLYTADGETWSTLNLNLYVNKILILENKLYILAEEGIYSGTTIANIVKISDKNLFSLSKRNNIYYAISSNYEIEKGTDLINWDVIKKPFFNETLNVGVYTEKGLFFTNDSEVVKKVGNNSEILYTESLSWLHLGNITECNNELIITTSSNILIKSSDYRNFSRFNTSGFTQLTKIVYGNGLYIGFYQNKLYSSEDLINWTLQSTTGAYIYEIIYDKYRNIFITVGGSGKIYTSSNGTDWVERTSNTTRPLYCVVATENQIVIGGRYCYLVSKNGIDFTVINTPTTEGNYRNIAYGDGVFIFSSSNNARILQEGENQSSYLVQSYINSDIAVIFYDEKQKIFVFITNSLYVLTMGYSDVVENIISCLSNNSDLSINLQVGKNELYIDNTSGAINAVLSYRQKYLGV